MKSFASISVFSLGVLTVIALSLLAAPVLAQLPNHTPGYLPIVSRGVTPTPTATQAPTVPAPTPIPTPQSVEDPQIYVNHFRSLAGVPAVTFNSTLNNNCWQHARYMAENMHLTHNQDPTKPYASAAGQVCAGNGNAWLGWGSAGYWQPEHSIEGWMGSPGHRLWLLYPTTPTFGYGFFYANNNYAGAALDVLSTANFNNDTSYSGWPLRYPAPNQTGVPSGGFPITINWRYFGSTPVISSTALSANGQPVSHTASTSLPAGHKGILITPNSLQPGTTYQVSISGTYGGAPFSYSWQFTTAP